MSRSFLFLAAALFMFTSAVAQPAPAVPVPATLFAFTVVDKPDFRWTVVSKGSVTCTKAGTDARGYDSIDMPIGATRNVVYTVQWYAKIIQGAVWVNIGGMDNGRVRVRGSIEEQAGEMWLEDICPQNKDVNGNLFVVASNDFIGEVSVKLIGAAGRRLMTF
jgi:hypothetical protein